MSVIHTINLMYCLIFISTCVCLPFLLTGTSKVCREDVECSRLQTCFQGPNSTQGHCIPFWPVDKTLCHERCQTEATVHEREFSSHQAQRFVYFPKVDNDTCVVGFQSVPLLNPREGAPAKLSGVVVSRENLWREWFVVMCSEL